MLNVFKTNLFFVSKDQSIESYWRRWSDAEKAAIKTWMDRNGPRSDYEAAIHELARSKIAELDARAIIKRGRELREKQG